MFGLTVLVVIGLYLLVSIGVVKWAVRYARENGKSTKRWGWGAVLVMYLLVFWDWIPTVAAHKYYCATEAGFWVYKTPEQWQKENPGVMETLVRKAVSDEYKIEKINGGFNTSYDVNQRLKVSNMVIRIVPLLGNYRQEFLLIDRKTNFVLTRQVSFGAGHSSGAPNSVFDFKFWVNFNECSGAAGNSTPVTWGLSESFFRNMGEKK